MTDGSNSFLRLGLFVVILMTSSFCGAFSFVEPLLNSESASGSKARELIQSGPLSFIQTIKETEFRERHQILWLDNLMDGIFGGGNYRNSSFALETP
jgi:hypothetical protein